MLRTAVVAVALGSAGPAVAQSSAAARYLVDEQIAAACEGQGRLDPVGPIEPDLTGDGRADLVIPHEAIACTGGPTRSLFSGAQVCSVILYVREGDLLVKKTEILGAGVALGSGSPPRVTGYAHGGAPWELVWDGATFAFR